MSKVKKTKLPAKKAPKKITSRKKAHPVMIDVIEDDEAREFFPELPETKIESSKTDLVSDFNYKEKDFPLEIDQQKKFFSELVTEIKDKKAKPAATHGHNHPDDQENKVNTHKSVNLYRRLAWRFVIFTIFLLVVVFYFSFSKLTITISPKGETLNDNILLKVQPTGAVGENAATDFREEIIGTVKEIALTEEKTFSATGEEFTGEEIYGQVKIINNSAKNQPLVATTRILSPDNKLFRIKEAVNVPAGGEVAVDIYADKPSEDLAISATTFTIPGLWLGLQDKIYAKSSTDFTYRQKVKKYVKASDIEEATKEMNDLLLAKAKLNQESLDKDSVVLYETLDATSFEISAKAGEAKDNFTVKAKGSLVTVVFSKEQVVKLAAAKLTLVVPDDKELADYNSENIYYTFENYDSKTGVATIKASFGGTMVLKSNTEIIDKKQLVNLNRQQLENYLKTFPEIKEYELKFSPSFINRAPRLPERIKIEIKGLER